MDEMTLDFCICCRQKREFQKAIKILYDYIIHIEDYKFKDDIIKKKQFFIDCCKRVIVSQDDIPYEEKIEYTDEKIDSIAKKLFAVKTIDKLGLYTDPVDKFRLESIEIELNKIQNDLNSLLSKYKYY